MSIHAGPNTVEDGLVLSLDSANFKSVNPRENLCPVNSVPNAVYDIEDSQILAPDGNPSRRFYEGTINLEGSLAITFSQSISVVQGKQYNYSCFIRQGSAGRSFRLQFDGAVSAFGSSLVIGFNPATQIVTSSFGGVVNTGFEDYSNGWYRFWFTTPIALASSNTITARIYMVNTAAGNALTNSYDNSTNLYVHYYGPQITTGLDVKPYVRTTGSAITLSTTITDISGNNTTGTLSNATFNTVFGGILSYNGTSGSCITPPLPQSMNAVFSVFAFVRLASLGDLFGVWGHDDPTGTLSCHFEVRSGAGGMRVRLGNVDRLCPSLPAGSWKYVGFTTNVNNHSYYVDGVLTDSWTGAKGAILGAGTIFQPAFAASRAAGADLAPDRTFNGDVSVCQIYNRALSAQEIAQNFQALRGRFGL